jgi:hypothetical protein
MLKSKKDCNYKEMLMWALIVYCNERNMEIECLKNNSCKNCLIEDVKVMVVNDMNGYEVENYMVRLLEIIDKGKKYA